MTGDELNPAARLDLELIGLRVEFSELIEITRLALHALLTVAVEAADRGETETARRLVEEAHTIIERLRGPG